MIIENNIKLWIKPCKGDIMGHIPTNNVSLSEFYPFRKMFYYNNIIPSGFLNRI